MVDSSGRSSFPERKAGVGPGSQLRSNVTDLPEAEIKKLGVREPITLTQDGANTLLKNMERTGRGLQGALVDLTDTIGKYERHLIKTQGVDVAKEFIRRLDEVFPDGITSIERQINESRAYENLLYEAGYLEDADPPTGRDKKGQFTFKDLDKEFNKLPESGRNRRSVKGKEILSIKDRGGVPAVIGRDKDGKLIYHPTKTIPYKLKLSQKGIDEVKNFKLPAYASANLPAIVEDVKPIEQQTRENKKRFYERQRVPSDDALPLANKVVSPKTGIEYDNFNAMQAAEGAAPPPGGETVEPNRGDVSRKAKGTVIVRSDVNTFKQAMGKAVSTNPQLPTHPLLYEGGKPNLFKGIMMEARKIDPKVSMNAMQDIKDYLFFTGYLEADKEVSGKMGPSRLSDADVPEYVKPSQKYYKQGLKVLDAGGSNEPLVIRKLSADPDIQSMSSGARSMPEITGPQSATPDKPVSERTSRLLNIIKSGGRKGLKALPFVAAADILTSSDPVGAAVGSTPLADATMEGFQARERAGTDYERVRSADEEAFSAMEKQQASDRLKGPRGFLYLD